MSDRLDQIEAHDLRDLEYILLEDPAYNSLLNHEAKARFKIIIANAMSLALRACFEKN